jgi:hypothetical protein
MNIAILDGKFSKQAYDYIIDHYEIGEIATREQIALECASPILLRMKVPLDLLTVSVRESIALPIGASSDSSYQMTTKGVFDAALSMVSSLYPFVDMIRASADIGPRICIAREIPVSTWQSLGFSVMSIAPEVAEAALTVRLETEAIDVSIEDLTDVLDRLLEGKLAKKILQIRKETADGFSFRLGTRTVHPTILEMIADHMEERSQSFPQCCSHKNYQVWVRQKVDAKVRALNMAFSDADTYMLDITDCDNLQILSLVSALMRGEVGLYVSK